jgi:predicted metal-dependent hydrolase
MNGEAVITEMVPVQGALIAVAFKRSARAKRVSLRIDPAQGVVITLPLRTSRRAGLALLHAHEDWVSEKLEAMPQPLTLRAGALVPVHGVPHEIIPIATGRGGAWIEDGKIFVTGQPEFLARRVSDCLKRLARQRLTAMAAQTAQRAALRPKIVRIKDTRSRWGSCAPDGTLAFCWRLICAPDFVQDYVVAHEVAHLKHMNHGPLFWSLTEQLTPHRQAASAWLASDGASLLRIG